MNKVNFLDLPKKSFYLEQSKDFDLLEDVEDVELDISSTTNSKKKTIEQLHSRLLDSLNFQKQNNAFPSTLPSEINIKFTQENIWEVFKKKVKDFWNGHDSQDIAKAGINSNTIFISTEFLALPTDPFLKEFSEKFDGQQSLLDAIFYHEFGHIISINHFPIIKKILEIENLQKTPLYQVMRNFEETFSDAYASLIHKEKHNSFGIYNYVASRNSTTLGNSKGFDFNINSITLPTLYLRPEGRGYKVGKLKHSRKFDVI